MGMFTGIGEKWDRFCDKTKPFREGTGKVLGGTGKVLKTTGSYLFRLRAVLLSAPVAVAAILLAMKNMDRLPDSVGLMLQTSGDFAVLVPKTMAVFGPLGITALCILLTVCSKKTVFPWLISVFTLILPVLIWFTNVYPA